MATELRPATGEDAARIARIWQAGWPDGHLGHVPDGLVAHRTPDYFDERAQALVPTTIVAEVDGVVAGFVAMLDDELDQVYVADEFRGAGIADLVLHAGERAVAGAGYSQAWLAVVPGNARARRFYERNGWVDDGEFIYRAETLSGTFEVPCRRYVRDL
jgi:GNAT superfamily N-acetyltransferase